MTKEKIMEEWKNWAFTHKQHLGRNCDIKEIENFISTFLDEYREVVINECIAALPEKKIIHDLDQQVNQDFDYTSEDIKNAVNESIRETKEKLIKLI